MHIYGCASVVAGGCVAQHVWQLLQQGSSQAAAGQVPHFPAGECVKQRGLQSSSASSPNLQASGSACLDVLCLYNCLGA